MWGFLYVNPKIFSDEKTDQEGNGCNPKAYGCHFKEAFPERLPACNGNIVIEEKYDGYRHKQGNAKTQKITAEKKIRQHKKDHGDDIRKTSVDRRFYSAGVAILGFGGKIFGGCH